MAETEAAHARRRVGQGGDIGRGLRLSVCPDYSTTGLQHKIMSGGRCMGIVAGDTLHKRVRGSRHMLKHPFDAWAIDLDVLKAAVNLDAWRVSIVDQETGKSYRATVQYILARGQHVNYGHGEQVALALDLWNPDESAPAATQARLL